MTGADIAPGLDLFAAAWLERWQSFGGHVYVDADTGRPSLMMPMPGIGGHPEIQGEGWQRDWNDGFDTGRWRELHDLLQLVPGGPEAVAAHVATFPNRITQRGVST